MVLTLARQRRGGGGGRELSDPPKVFCNNALTTCKRYRNFSDEVEFLRSIMKSNKKFAEAFNLITSRYIALTTS